MLFAIGMMATACSDDINEVNYPLTVTTPTVTAVSGSSAIVTATATGSHIIPRGVCYSTSTNPTISDDKVYSASKDMVLTIGGLAKSTTYYVRGFAQTSYEVVYSDEVSFTTTSSESADDNPQTEGPSALKRVSVHLAHINALEEPCHIAAQLLHNLHAFFVLQHIFRF